VAPLTHEDLEHVGALWEEWTSGLGYDLDVQVVGEHCAGMDPDRPLGAIAVAKLSLRLKIWKVSPPAPTLIFDETCPYDGEVLKADVRALARVIGKRNGSPGERE
jgi:hypothetical protein